MLTHADFTGTALSLTSQDRLLVYQGAEDDPTFLCAFDWSGYALVAVDTSVSMYRSGLPKGLTSGLNAVISADWTTYRYNYWAYAGTDTGDASALHVEYGIVLRRFLDTGITDILLRRQQPNQLRGLETVLSHWVGDSVRGEGKCSCGVGDAVGVIVCGRGVGAPVGGVGVGVGTGVGQGAVLHSLFGAAGQAAPPPRGLRSTTIARACTPVPHDTSHEPQRPILT